MQKSEINTHFSACFLFETVKFHCDSPDQDVRNKHGVLRPTGSTT